MLFKNHKCYTYICFILTLCMLHCIKIQGNERTIMGTSNGNLWIAEEDGINFVEKKLPWANNKIDPSQKESKDNPNLGYGNIYSATYNGNVLAVSGDLNHIFYSFDRGDTWFLNQYIRKELVVKYLDDSNIERTRDSLDLQGIAYGNNTWVAAASRSVIITATDITGKWQYQNCREAFPDVDLGPQGRCNMFFRGLLFGKGYFVVYGAPQTGSKQIVAFYSKDAKVWKVIPGLSSNVAVIIFRNGRFYVPAGEDVIHTEDISSGKWETIPKITDGVGGIAFISSAMDANEKNTLLIGGRDENFYVIVEGRGFETCQERDDLVIPGKVATTCLGFDTRRLGSVSSISYTPSNNGTWRIGTAKGYLFYNIGGNFQELAHKKYGFDPINLIFSY